MCGGLGLTFGALEGRGVPRPRRVAVSREIPKFEVRDGEPDDGGLVQLGGDGAWQRQHLGQLVELSVLLVPPRPRGIS